MGTIVRLWQVLKERFTKLVVVYSLHYIVGRILRSIHSQLKIELKFQFRNLLPQLSVLHLQKDVLGENPNECCKCYGDRCTKLQSDQVQYK